MKTNSLLIAIFLLLSVQISFAKTEASAVLDGIVAIVNNQIITHSELLQEEVALKEQMDTNSDMAKLHSAKLREKVIKQLIDQTLELQLAAERGISVDEKALDLAIRDIAKRNNLSLSQFKEALRNHGVVYANFRERIRKQMILARLQQAFIGDSVQINEQEINDFLKNTAAVNTVLREYHLKRLTKVQARNYLYQKKLQEQSAAWLEKLRESAYVKIIQ